MAYLSGGSPGVPDDEEEASQRLQFSNPTTGGGAGIFGNTTAPSGLPNNPAPQADSSNSGWTNIQNYEGANQDQAANMGSQVAGYVGDQGAAAQNDVNNLSNNFANQADNSTNDVVWNPGAQASVGKDISDAEGLGAGGSINPNDVSDFGKYADATYGGWNNLSGDTSDYNTALQGINQAQGSLGELGSEAGRDQLLHNVYGNDSANGYTSGENNLDQALTEGSGAAQNDYRKVQSDYGGINNWMNTASNTANQEVNAAESNDAQSQTNAAKALGSYGTYTASTTPGSAGSYTGGSGALGNWGQGLYNNLSGDVGAYNTAQTDLNASEAAGQLTKDQIATLNLNPDMQTFGAKFGSTDAQMGTADNLANTATGGNYAQEAALNQLAGTLPNGAGSANTGPLNQSFIAQAGTGAGVNGTPMYGLTMGPNGQSVFQGQVNQAAGTVANEIAPIYGSALGPTGSAHLFNYNPTADTVDIGGATNSLGDLAINHYSLNPNSPNYIGNGYGGEANRDTGTSATEQDQLDYLNDGYNPQWNSLRNTLTDTLTNPNGIGGSANTYTNPYMARGGEVKSPEPEDHMAYGGFPTLGKGLRPADRILNEHLLPEIKPPGIPKLPEAYQKLPTLPKFEKGGAVMPHSIKYPIRTPGLAKASLDRVMREGSPAEKQVVIRQVRAHHPHLFADGGDAGGDSTETVGQIIHYPGTEPSPTPHYSRGGLTTDDRKHIAAKNFALPGKHYPIENIEHARNALARISEYGSPVEQAKVRAAVHSKYPSLAQPFNRILGAVKGGRRDFRSGGKVPGRGNTASGVNSYSNDVIPSVLSPQEIVLPRSVTQSKDPVAAAADFVRKTLKKQSGR